MVKSIKNINMLAAKHLPHSINCPWEDGLCFFNIAAALEAALPV
jgi:hypothetical protein